MPAKAGIHLPSARQRPKSPSNRCIAAIAPHSYDAAQHIILSEYAGRLCYKESEDKPQKV
jgi:hypothetical protein